MKNVLAVLALMFCVTSAYAIEFDGGGGSGGSAFTGTLSGDPATFFPDPSLTTRKGYFMSRSARSGGDDYALQTGMVKGCTWNSGTALWTRTETGIGRCWTFGVSFTGDLTIKYSASIASGATTSDAGWTRTAELLDASSLWTQIDSVLVLAGNVTMGSTNQVTGGATSAGTGVRFGSAGEIYPPSIVFASLGTPGNGAVVFCSDCTFANPCASGGTGAIAKRLNGAWRCD